MKEFFSFPISLVFCIVGLCAHGPRYEQNLPPLPAPPLRYEMDWSGNPSVDFVWREIRKNFHPDDTRMVRKILVVWRDGEYGSVDSLLDPRSININVVELHSEDPREFSEEGALTRILREVDPERTVMGA